MSGDLTDQASDLEELHREKAYRAVQAALRLDETAASGECRYCAEKIAPEARFCDADCRDDFERASKMQKISGA